MVLELKPVHQMQNTIEHLGLPHASDILQNTRSTRTNALMRWLCWQMPYHTAHHSYPSVPFWQLRKLNDKIENAAGPVHRMGWIEFQIEVIRRLAQKDESQWPMDEVWIVPLKDGRQIHLEAWPGMGTRQLKTYTSLWSMMPHDASGDILPYDAICEKVAVAGYDGMAIDLGAGDVAQARAVRPHMERNGLTPLIVAFPRTVESLRETLVMAQDFGAPFVDVIGQVMPLSVDGMIPVIRRWIDMADEVGMPIQFETHRNRGHHQRPLCHTVPDRCCA